MYKDYLSFYMVDKENALVHVMAVFNGKKDYMRVMRKFFESPLLIGENEHNTPFPY